MRIGIDATPLPAQPVGAGVYIIQLIRALATEPGAHRLVVFAQRGRRDLIDTPRLTGVEWIETPDLSPARRLVWEQVALPALARRAGVEVLHSLHYTRPYFLPCASVVTFHDMTFFLYPKLHTFSKRVFFPWMMRMSARKAQAIIAVSENTHRDAVRILKIAPDKIFTVQNGIGAEFRPIDDPALLQACRKKYNLEQPFFLYVGTVEPRKNLPLLLRAFARLAAQGSDFSLVIVGRLGWMYEDVFRLVESLGLSGRVQFTGYVPAEDLPMVYNLAQIFVYPSLYEGFGFPPLEAMACGAPVITTASSAMRDQVGDAAILTPPGDEQALYEAMDQLAYNPELRRMLSVRGRSQAAQYTWQTTAQKTLQVYQWAILNR